MEYQNYLFVIITTIIIVFILYHFRFLFLNHSLKITNNKKDFNDYFSNILLNIKGNTIVLADNILDPELYDYLYLYLKNVLNNNKKIIIYFGPSIGLLNKNKDFINKDGSFNELYKFTFSNLHSLIKLKMNFNDNLELRFVDKQFKDSFFYSEDDKIAWKKDEHELFSDFTTLFRTNVDKNVINNIKELETKFLNNYVVIDKESLYKLSFCFKV